VSARQIQYTSRADVCFLQQDFANAMDSWAFWLRNTFEVST